MAEAAEEAEAPAERGPYATVGPGWHTFDRHRYLAIFAHEFGIRPWEIGLLDVEDFEALIDAAEEMIERPLGGG